MNDPKLIAKSSTTIRAPTDHVWKALTDPAAIEHYMFGAKVDSEWHEGSPITWKGEYQGKAYEDKGRILEMRRGKRLRYSHFSPMAGLPDSPENYHTVTIDLEGSGGDTRVSLTQDNNSDEKARAHSEKNWDAMLQGLKKYVEQ
ncbi:MAG TPA: SRPBCC domain-containing protein [Usitatibacter sp.]|nr:SRPBCC domain-containing protein [Usitatibacter sp.]